MVRYYVILGPGRVENNDKEWQYWDDRLTIRDYINRTLKLTSVIPEDYENDPDTFEIITKKQKTEKLNKLGVYYNNWALINSSELTKLLVK